MPIPSSHCIETAAANVISTLLIQGWMATLLTNGKGVLNDSGWRDPKKFFVPCCWDYYALNIARTGFLMLLNSKHWSLVGIWQHSIIKYIWTGSPKSFPKVNFQDTLLVSKSREKSTQNIIRLLKLLKIDQMPLVSLFFLLYQQKYQRKIYFICLLLRLKNSTYPNSLDDCKS